jgi:peroxiredoxin
MRTASYNRTMSFFAKQRRLLSAGARTPDFRLPLLDGTETTMHDIISNGPALVAFFKVSCPVCQMTLPFLGRIQSAGSLPVYAVSQNDARDTREFNRRFGVTVPTLLDSEKDGFVTSNAFGISSVPTMFLIEKDGSIARVIEGWSKSEIERLGALAGVKPFHPNDSVPEWKAG